MYPVNSKEGLADLLTGMEYPFELNEIQKNALSGTDLVIVFGASDDLMEFRGAIYDEVGCWDGGKAYLHKSGLLRNECDEDDCPYFKLLMADATTVEALWCKEEGFSWTYKTDIPHSTFLIMEDDETYCRGIVFNLSDVKSLIK